MKANPYITYSYVKENPRDPWDKAVGYLNKNSNNANFPVWVVF